jgi:hypothetical protein
MSATWRMSGLTIIGKHGNKETFEEFFVSQVSRILWDSTLINLEGT